MSELIKSYYLENKGVFEENFKLVLDKFDMEAIHKMRTSTKRLRALFILLEYLTNGKFRAKKQLKTLRVVFKHAGNIREIQIENLLVQQNEIELNKAFPEYIEYLKRREHKEIASFLKSLPPIEIRTQILNDNKVLRTIDNLTEKDLRENTLHFIREKVEAIHQNIAKPASNHRIHQNRTYLKQLYYLYEILTGLSGITLIMNMNAERIRDIEQYLGTWHDLVNSPVYMNAFLKTKSDDGFTKFRPLKQKIAKDRKGMRKEILTVFYPELTTKA